MAQKRMVIVEGVRTAIGKFGGSLKEVPAEFLQAFCFRHVVKKSKIDPTSIDDIAVGNLCSLEGNVAGLAASIAKIPYSVSSSVVGRNCASGIEAISRLCQAGLSGDGDIFLAGGVENMSRIPYVLDDIRFGPRLQPRILKDALWDGLYCKISGMMMGRTGENVAQKWEITREAQDEFAVGSHRKASLAWQNQKFDSQIYPIPIQERMNIRGDSGEKIVPMNQVIFSKDESVNDALVQNPEKASSAPAIFMDDNIAEPARVKRYIDKSGTFVIEKSVYLGGTVTPANACPMNDGAAAVLIMTEEKAVALGLTPLAYVVSYAYAGCDPALMGEGPIYAVPKALKKAGLKMNDIDVFELNEAFAAQVIVCRDQLHIPEEKLNIWGGAIALGHPLGATGMIKVIKAIHILQELQKRYAVITMCVGGGQGGCLIIERA